MPRRLTGGSKFRKTYRPSAPTAYRRLSYGYSRGPVRSQSYRGRGGYWQNLKNRWAEGGGKYKDAFASAGSTLGAGIGGPKGAVLGNLAGGLFNRALYALTGFGDYKVHKNVLLEETNDPPAIQNVGNKAFVIRHREYITDIFSSTAASGGSPFGLLSFPINPGNATTFPYLSSIADKFEQYRIEGMVFEYKSNYSDAVVTNNGSIGTVILATEYNAGAPLFTSKQAMENYQFAQSSKPSNSILHPIECATRQNVLSELYVRHGAVPVGEDIKTYDFGNFQIASQSIPSSSTPVNLGELWVSYQIALIKPKIPTSSSSSYTDSGFAAFSGVANNAGVAPWGSVPTPYNNLVKRGSSNLPINLGTDGKFTIQCGSVPMMYQVDAFWYAMNPDATAVWRAPTVILTNATKRNSTTTGPYQEIQIPTGANPGTGCSTHSYFLVPAAVPTAQQAVLEFNPATFSASVTNPTKCEVFFNAVPVSLT